MTSDRMGGVRAGPKSGSTPNVICPRNIDGLRSWNTDQKLPSGAAVGYLDVIMLDLTPVSRPGGEKS